MSNPLATIGIGSGIDFGAVYDKLKKAEEASVAARPDKQLEKLSTEQKDLTSLITHVNTLKGSISSLRDGSLFLKRSVDVVGVGGDKASVSVDVLSGVNKANFSIDVENLAQKDSYQSRSFHEKSSTLFNDEDMYIKDPTNPSNNKPFNEGKFSISIDGKTFTIDVKSTDTLETLVDKMTNAVSDQSLSGAQDDKNKLSDYVDIRALKVDSSDNYSLIVSSKDTGIKNKITFGVVGDNAEQMQFSQNILNKLGFGGDAGLGSGLQIDKMKEIESIEKQMSDMLANKPLDQTDDDIKNSQAYQDLQKQLEESKAQLSDIKKQNPLEYIESKIKQADEEMDKILSKYKISKDENLSLDDIIKKISDSGHQDSENDIKLFSKQHADKSTFESKLDSYKKMEEQFHISHAKDAVFTYDGIKITRSSNQIDDILPGANIKLLKTGVSNVNISSDTGKLKEGIDDFVKNYNTLIANLDAATAYNDETKIAGTFQGVNEVTRIKTELANIINKVSTDSKYSLSALGFEINKDGVLEFDSTVFDTAYNKDPKGIEEYFGGKTVYTPYENHGKTISGSNANTILAKGDLKINGKDIVFSDEDIKALENNKDPRKLLDILKKTIDNAKIDGLLVTIDNTNNTINFKTNGISGFEIDGNTDKIRALGLDKVSIDSKGEDIKGIFTEMRELIDGYTGNEGTLTRYSARIGEDTKNLQKEKEQALKDLESRYATMATRFNLYDQMITKMKSQESVLSSMINAQFASK